MLQIYLNYIIYVFFERVIHHPLISNVYTDLLPTVFLSYYVKYIPNSYRIYPRVPLTHINLYKHVFVFNMYFIFAEILTESFMFIMINIFMIFICSDWSRNYRFNKCIFLMSHIEYNWFYCDSIRVHSNRVKLWIRRKRTLYFNSIRINYMIVNLHHLLVSRAHCIKMHFWKLLGWRSWNEFRWSIRLYCRILSNIRILHLITSVGVIGVVACLEGNLYLYDCLQICW